jgi:tRNA(Ile)-lysidine synthase
MTERFARAADSLGLVRDGAFVLAASGGADSGAAMLLLRAIAPNATIVACYIDHGLRPRASIARDRAAVRAQARAAGAKMLVRRVHLGASGGSPEERARAARYRVLSATAGETGARFVVTGHHQDDVVETSLLALARGAGIDGAAAMRPLRPLRDGVSVVRPLLWATKAQCAALLERRGLAVSHDETNDDRTIPRNAVRALLAGLEKALPGASRSVARSAALLADDRALLEGMSAAAWRTALGFDGRLSAVKLRRMPVALVRRVVRHAVARSGAGLRDFSYEHCDTIAQAIKSGRGGRYHAGAVDVVLSAGKVIVQTRAATVASIASPAVSPMRIDLRSLPQSIATPFGLVTLARRAHTGRAIRKSDVQRLDLGALVASGDIELRQARAGDRCIPSGRTRTVSLARFLAKSGVPKPLRGTTPVLCAGGRIAAVLGVRVMEPYKPKGKGPQLEVGWHRADS